MVNLKELFFTMCRLTDIYKKESFMTAAARLVFFCHLYVFKWRTVFLKKKRKLKHIEKSTMSSNPTLLIQMCTRKNHKQIIFTYFQTVLIKKQNKSYTNSKVE